MVLARPLAWHVARETGVAAELRTLAMAAEEVALVAAREARLAARTLARVAAHQLLPARCPTRLMTSVGGVVADAAVAWTRMTAAVERRFTLEWTLGCILLKAALHEDMVRLVAAGDAHRLLTLLHHVVLPLVTWYPARVSQIGAETHLDFFCACVFIHPSRAFHHRYVTASK